MGAGRDMELKVIMDQLADWRRRYGVRHIILSVESDGLGKAHGLVDGELFCVSGQYESYKDIQRNETPAGGAAGESR